MNRLLVAILSSNSLFPVSVMALLSSFSSSASPLSLAGLIFLSGTSDMFHQSPQTATVTDVGHHTRESALLLPLRFIGLLLFFVKS